MPPFGTPAFFSETPTASRLAEHVFQSLLFTAQNVTAAPSPHFEFEPLVSNLSSGAIFDCALAAM